MNADYGRTSTARRWSKCNFCTRKISPGQQIMLTSYGHIHVVPCAARIPGHHRGAA